MPVTFRNRSAGFLWGFAVIWVVMLVAMTYVLLRDGPPVGYSMPTMSLVFAFFWAAGLGLLCFVASKPCIRLDVYTRSGVTATWRYPHKTVTKSFASSQVSRAEVVQSRDDEGDAYFHAVARTASGEHLHISEGHDRSACDEACETFNHALFDERASGSDHVGA